MLLWAISLFVLGVVNDMSVTVGTYKFIYLIRYSYFGMVLLIDHALTRRCWKQPAFAGGLADEGRTRMFQHVDGVYFG